MLEQLFQVAADSSITIRETMISMLVAVVLGAVIAAVYLAVTKRENRSQGFFLTLVLLPAVVAVVIVLVGSNVARAFSIAGVFSLVRFRSAPGEGKDISLVFLAMAAGLAAGLGYLTLALIVTVVLAVIIVLISIVGRKLIHTDGKQLRILIPEDMDYQGAFDDLFSAYTNKVSLERVKTTNMGTLYELTYHIVPKQGINEKKFLDELRCRNGNLNIVLSRKEPQQGQL